MKINMDGSCMKGGRDIASGSVIRDCLGQWIKGFIWHGHNASMLALELKGIALGLRLAWSLGLDRVCLESNSLKALAMAKHKCGL